ncbi:hypothetical protein BDN72DRAFT_881800 [Pluteus cervinus]|uniref:Uncharacterized protein n=1 Tax=Pluteus cervinus TaxID=181527 RepID=A0ACD3AEC6_9AGAR|nr:hypothetical protein BDN72DRAFT_881800 [Pluteus cervinus]
MSYRTLLSGASNVRTEIEMGDDDDDDRQRPQPELKCPLWPPLGSRIHPHFQAGLWSALGSRIQPHFHEKWLRRVRSPEAFVTTTVEEVGGDGDGSNMPGFNLFSVANGNRTYPVHNAFPHVSHLRVHQDWLIIATAYILHISYLALLKNTVSPTAVLGVNVIHALLSLMDDASDGRGLIMVGAYNVVMVVVMNGGRSGEWRSRSSFEAMMKDNIPRSSCTSRVIRRHEWWAGNEGNWKKKGDLKRIENILNNDENGDATIGVRVTSSDRVVVKRSSRGVWRQETYWGQGYCVLEK